MRRILRTAAASAGILLLSACGVVGIRTSNEAGGPVGVGVQETAGPSPTPTETEDPVPEGVTVTGVDFGADCPVDMKVGLPDGWTFVSTPGQYQSAFDSAATTSGPLVSVTCREPYSTGSASEIIGSAEEYAFNEPGTSVVAERKGQFGNGYYWSYQADLDPAEIFAVESKQSTYYGAEIAYSIQGKIYQVSYGAVAASDDTETVEALGAAASVIELEGIPLTMPEWVS